MEAEKHEKQKFASNMVKHQYSPVQNLMFVNNFSKFKPRKKILTVLDSTKTWLLKYIQNTLLDILRNAATKVHIFFLKHPEAEENILGH